MLVMMPLVQRVDCTPLANAICYIPELRQALVLTLLISLNFGINSYISSGGFSFVEISFFFISAICALILYLSQELQRKLSICFFSVLFLFCVALVFASGEKIANELASEDLIFIPIALIIGIYIKFIQVIFITVVSAGLMIGGLAINFGDFPHETYVYNLYAAPIALSYFLLSSFRAKHHKLHPTHLSSSSSAKELFERVKKLGKHQKWIFWFGSAFFIAPQILSRPLNLSSGVTVALAGIGTAICIWVLRDQTMQKIEHIDNSSPNVVLFRNFESDETEINSRSIALNLKYMLGLTENETIETFISQAFCGESFIVVGLPEGEYDPLGAKRAVADNDKWQNQVSNLIRSTPKLLISITGSEGTKWEIQEIFRLGEQAKSLFFGRECEDLLAEDIGEAFFSLDHNVLDMIEALICEASKAGKAFAFHFDEPHVTWFQSKYDCAEDYEAIFLTWRWQLENGVIVGARET